MRLSPPHALTFLLALTAAPAALGQKLPSEVAAPAAPTPERPPSQPEDYKVYTEHPRLLLPARRLRLLRRERERKTMRWEQFQTLIAGNAAMPEPGFAFALYAIVAEDPAVARKAIQWALGPGTDLRQLSLVFDWCQPWLSESQSKTLAQKMQQLLEQQRNPAAVPAVRDRVFAAVALSDHVPELPERVLRTVFSEWWMQRTAPALLKNRTAHPRADGYPLMEILHAVQDNLHFDMRDNALEFFRDLPLHRVISYYPAVFPAADAFYRIPQYPGLGEPEITPAAQSRAADLSIVAFDANALEHQFVQGWLIQDRYIMKSPYGAPYEFLWANPYQPGLSYHHLPLYFHDPKSGTLFLRSSWEEDAVWLSYQKGDMELFMDGKRSGLKPASIREPLQIGEHVVMVAEGEMQWSLNLPATTRYFLIGLKPHTVYDIEVDDQELTEGQTDAGGILALTFPAAENLGVRIRPFAPGARK